MEVLGTSPNIIGNLSWYKDMDYSYAQVIVDSFERFRHILLCTEFDYSWRESGKNTLLLERLDVFREYIKTYRAKESMQNLQGVCDVLETIRAENTDLGEFFLKSLDECIELLRNYVHHNGLVSLDTESIALMPTFKNAWGRGQQYVSFVKRI